MPHALAAGPIRFGTFLPPLHKMGIGPTTLFEQDLEMIELADRVGLQEVWLGEHHSGGHEPIGCPELMLAAAARRTRTIRLGTAVNSLPYHNPLTLASRLTLLDHLSHGRAMMGFGPGQLSSDAHMLGIDVARQRDMMLESAEVIVRLMNGETVTHECDWFKLRDAHLQVRPYQVPTLEMVAAAVTSPSGPKTAGRLGIGMINLSATNPAAFQALVDHWSICEHEAQLAGTSVSRENWRLSAIMHLAETEERAFADCEYGFAEIWRYLGEISPLPVSDPSKHWRELLEEAVESGYVVVGTPDTAISVIRRLADRTGGFGSFVMTQADFASFEARKMGLNLFARYVVPEFRHQLGSLRRSHDWVLSQKDAEATVWRTRTMSAIEAAKDQYDRERERKS
jgi:limonene 1,2-monooxygenase